MFLPLEAEDEISFVPLQAFFSVQVVLQGHFKGVINVIFNNAHLKLAKLFENCL